MGQHLAKLVLLSMPLGGCSLIYSSERLPELNDAPPADVNLSGLTIERVSPAVLLEGQGDGGSRPAVLVIHGTNIAAGATVEIKPHQGEPSIQSWTIDNEAAVVDAYGQSIAVPIRLNVDANIGPRPPATSPSIRLDVTVTQPAPFTDIRATLGDDEDPVLTLQGLPELTGTPSSTLLNDPLYSRIDATDIPTVDRTGPLILRSTSSITIGGAGPLALNASGQTPGPGGFRGGDGGQPGVIGGAGDGKQGDGAGGGRPNGGGAGFAQMGEAGSGASGPIAGEASLTTLESPNRGSGGAGGKGADAALGARGGAGGGGGGTLELTAGGDLIVMVPIEAMGAKGGNGNGTATAGGGGSGGVVLLRAGRNLSVAGPGITATGGPRGDGGNGAAGKGSDGRIRIDTPDPDSQIVSTPDVGYRGPRFDSMTPMIVREEKPQLTFVGQPNALIKYTIEGGEEGRTLGPIEISLMSNGRTTVPLAMPLFRGLNRLCALVTGVTERRDEAENCITLAYLY
jgi:hypothetical protein